jgi:4'-phosphopantetheinyl transferase
VRLTSDCSTCSIREGAEKRIQEGAAPEEWVVPQGALTLSAGEIHIWRADLKPDKSAISILETILAPEERDKAHGFRSECDGNAYVVARGALRVILARYLNQMPAELVLRYGKFGKPRLAESNLRFNVAHANGWALYAISRTVDVGVDLEQVHPEIDMSFAAQTWFPLGATADSARAFFQAWTRTEAYGKARGFGLSFMNLATPLMDARAPAGWWFHDFLPLDGYVAAVAARGVKYQLRHFEWDASQPVPRWGFDAKGISVRSDWGEQRL